MKKFSTLKKIILIVILIIAALLCFVAVILGDELKSAMSLEQISEGNLDERSGDVYTIEIEGDYYLDDFVDQGGVKSDNELLSFLIKSLSDGIVDVELDINSVGCTAFTAASDDGDRYFGRNYDMYPIINTCVVKTNPGNGRYASIAVSDLQMVGIDKKKGVTTFVDKLLCALTPYVCVDGMNEKGLAGGVFSSHQEGSTDQNTDKPDATTTSIFRLMLDYCSNVDEAVELAKIYDYHDSIDSAYHIIVADASGKSAVIEWVNGNEDEDKNTGSERKLVVNYNTEDYQVLANFIVTPDYYTRDMNSVYSYNRYSSVYNDLKAANGVMSEDEMFKTLKKVKRSRMDDGEVTAHTVLYNMEEKTVTLVDNEHFNDKNHIFRFSFDE